VRAHRAKVTVDSAFGEGSTFTITLPPASLAARSVPAGRALEERKESEEPAA